ncbi:ATP-dependent DNA ligase [Candidatus Micrarchaeota archaeon]|nr:ATP-dependent DNA ligase [Candidatus Micrarchaeota archaeon]
MLFSDLTAVFEKLEATRARLEITSDVAKLLKECDSRNVRKVVYLLQGIVQPSFTGVDLGVGDKLAQQAISRVSGKTIKQIEASYRKTGDLGETGKELLSIKAQTSLVNAELSVDKVYDNFYKIATASGQGSQDLKIKLLSELLSNSSPVEAKVILRFTTGSLRLGLGDQTIIDAFSFFEKGDKSVKQVFEKAFNFTSDLGFVAELFFEKGLQAVDEVKPMPFNPIRPALAERLQDSKEIFEKLGKCSVEGKYDGFRLQVHLSNGRVEIYSRKQEKITEMFPEIVEGVKKYFNAKQVIFEGEAIVVKDGKFLPFQATIQRKRKHGVSEKAKELPLKLYCFELLYLDGKDLTGLKYEQRRTKLDSIIKNNTDVVLANRIIASSSEEIEEYFLDCLAKGLEGVIAKDLNAPYVAGGRKFAWIKLKKSYSDKLVDTVDVVIVGYYYGKGKRTQFGFGGLLTAVLNEDSNEFETIAKIGTGFSEEQMSFFQNELGKIKLKQKPSNVSSLIDADEWVQPKIVVEIAADEITKSPMHTAGMVGREGYALRFPRFLRIREDKSVDECTTVLEVLELFERQRR